MVRLLEPESSEKDAPITAPCGVRYESDMDRERAEAFIEALHRAQEELYGGGDPEPVRRLLAPDVVWHVPGATSIAGSHRGADAVIDYMLRRRELADNTFWMFRRDLLVGEGDAFAALTDGRATIGGRERVWSTVGLYRLAGDLLAECRLIPFDQAEFDEIWSLNSQPSPDGPGERSDSPPP
jgi:hypothetical protein